MDHFKGLNDQERFNNDVLKELRTMNQTLEQLSILLKADLSSKTMKQGVLDLEPDNRPKHNRGRSSNAQ